MSRLVLPEALARDAVRPGNPVYPLLRSTYTTTASPAVILRPRDDAEVAAAVVYAAESELPVSVRSGGHGLSGRSSNDGGIVIDLGSMDAVRIVVPARGVVRIQAGARWGDVAARLATAGLAISSGDHGNVGVGGLATAGGVGWLVRTFGLTVDRVRAATVVTVDGIVHRVDAVHEPDLLWAVRGAGDAVGIVTEVEIEAMHLTEVGIGHVALEADRDGAALRRVSEFMREAPRELTTKGLILPDGERFVLQLTAVVASADPERIRALIEPLAALGTRPLGLQASLAPYTALVGRDQVHANVGQQPSTTTNALVARVDDDIARAIMDVAAHPAGPFVQLRALGGAVSDVPSDATAWAHRSHELLVIASTFPPDDGRGLDDAFAALAGSTDAAYRNFESRPDERSFLRAFPGAAGARVRQLRRVHDPDGVLTRVDAARGTRAA